MLNVLARLNNNSIIYYYKIKITNFLNYKYILIILAKFLNF